MSEQQLQGNLELENSEPELAALEQYENAENLREAWSGGLAELFSPLIAAEIARDLGVGSLRCKILTQLFYLGLANNGDANARSWVHTLEQDIYEPLAAGWEKGAQIPEADGFYKQNAISAKYFKIGWFLRALRMGYFSLSDCPQGEAPAFAEIDMVEEYRDQKIRPFKDLGFCFVSELERNSEYAGLQEKIENHPEQFFDWEGGELENYQLMLKRRLLMKMLLRIIPFSNLNYCGPEIFICPSTLKFKRAGLWHEERGSLGNQLRYEAALDQERERVRSSVPVAQQKAVHKLLTRISRASQYLADKPSLHVKQALAQAEGWIRTKLSGNLQQEYLRKLETFHEEEQWDRISFGF